MLIFCDIKRFLGPRQQSVSRPQFEIDVSFAGFSGDHEDDPSFARILSTFTREAVEASLDLASHPNSAITVSIKVLEFDGNLDSLISPCINGTTIALEDAGIALHDIVLSVSIPVRGLDGADRPDVEKDESLASIAMVVGTSDVRFINFRGKVGNPLIVQALVQRANNLVFNLSEHLGVRRLA